jgi:hypothetical protein
MRRFFLCWKRPENSPLARLKCRLEGNLFLDHSKLLLQGLRCSAFVFKFRFLLFPLGSASNSSRLLPRLLLPYLFSSVFPLITYSIKQSVRKVLTIQLAFFYFILFILFALTLCNNSFFHMSLSNDLIRPSPLPHSKAFNLLLLYFPKCSAFSTMKSMLQM